jgi:hypothetical protein
MANHSLQERPVANDQDAEANWVQASLNYLADTSVKPVSFNPPTGPARRIGNYRTFDVRIQDARPIARELSLDRQGFVLTKHLTAVKDFYDSEQVRAVYYPEMESLVRQLTGATKVIVFDHTIRSAEERGLRVPVHVVHNDYTEKSGPQRVRDLLNEAEAEARLKRRFAEFNVWRPITGPVLTSPLALADAQSIRPEDLATCDLVYTDRIGEIYHGVHNPSHRWSYFPRMERHEAVLIKCYDSANDGRARFCLHTAFDDPTSPANAPPRESIEIRTFAFFDA